MNEPDDDRLAALRAAVTGDLRAAIDEVAPSPTQQARDLERLLERARSRRRRELQIGVPTALAAASLIAFALVRTPPPPPAPGGDVVRITYGEADNPSAALLIDLVIHQAE